MHGYRHEEANLKLIINLLEMLPQWKHVRVLADDTDIFVLAPGIFHFAIQASSSSLKKKI